MRDLGPSFRRLAFYLYFWSATSLNPDHFSDLELGAKLLSFVFRESHYS